MSGALPPHAHEHEASHDHDHGHDHNEPSNSHTHAHSCPCTDHSHDDTPPEAPPIHPSTRDLERGTGTEKIAIAISGMDCSSCGTKMDRTLRRVPGVSSVRVNFVMGRAEFLLDTSVTSVINAVRAAEHGTGFTCTVLVSDDQTLDVAVSGKQAAEDMVRRGEGLEGVTQAVVVEKGNVVRVSYDPRIVGARTLLGRLGAGLDDLAPPADNPSVKSGRRRMWDQLRKTIAAAILTIPVAVLAWAEGLVSERTRALVSLVLATLVQLIAVPDFYRPALGALIRSRVVEMDMLVVVSITAAYGYSVVAFGFRMAGKPLDTSEFFETSTLLITLVLLGRLVTAIARNRAVSAVSMRSLQAARAVVIVQEGGGSLDIDARLLQYGDVITILPHTTVPTDAVVVSGSSEVDESMLTGESLPVPKQPAGPVIAGTLNGDGTLTARLTRLPGRNTVTDIARLVEEASNQKPRVQDMADRVASVFVGVVSLITVGVIIVWVGVGIRMRHYSVGKAVSNAITYAVATLAVSCPCALGLAVPMVLVVAGGIAARNGVVIKSTEITERARKVTDVIFDKTGTITEDELDVVEEMEMAVVGDADEALSIAKALVTGNKHPVSMAVAKHLEQRDITPAAVDDVQIVPGRGVGAFYKGARVCAGNPQWAGGEEEEQVTRLQQAGMTLLVVSHDSTPIVVFGLRTRIRPEAKEVVSELIRRGITVHMVSGDQKKAVEDVAAEVGIENVAARCSPREKAEYVAALRPTAPKKKRRLEASKQVIMFVGDGTNDAGAVAAADIGVQVGSASSASEVTRGAAHVVLLSGLQGVPFLLDISAVSFRRMVFNFVWSGVYNVSAILLASGALIKVRVPPAYAGLGELVSVLPVVAAAFTMLLTKIRTKA